jgi:hypothetical protein
MPKKTSPYNEFKEWLLNPYPNSTLKEDIIRAINPKTVLHMFGCFGEITIFLDEYFNKFELMNCNPIEFYIFLKEVVQNNRIGKYDFSYFYSMKKDKEIIKLQRKLPYMKKYEIYNLLEYCKDDSENDSFLENLELNKVKKKKVSKKVKDKDIPLEAETFDDLNLKNIKTFNEWKNCFQK